MLGGGVALSYAVPDAVGEVTGRMGKVTGGLVESIKEGYSAFVDKFGGVADVTKEYIMKLKDQFLPYASVDGATDFVDKVINDNFAYAR